MANHPSDEEWDWFEDVPHYVDVWRAGYAQALKDTHTEQLELPL